ncbi:diguanylate cyclase domain-containing protein [Halalkalibacter nanhaiisediminis]|uniref:PAS domain S-box-containing protein/diguanylate cyclase (GGDEF)-like protein n=1 Tax=Halalkalibacter nanhaiisediminis TaxID=688079 RepID=A0A562QQP0_9BACI|nr:diguanylate cyclase [Halalkalibacter nanhaiisediminis]TWI59027.1 PAS domain S-box-containing protein/diguanylate cyclase (GGDEF)-like protein [Halalkalibacter nanhaiisediminis]
MLNIIHTHGTHNMTLVVFSIILAIFSSYTALDLISRYRFSKRFIIGKYWFVSASIAMGSGIWAMHFVGMLAYDINIDVRYHTLLVIVTMILPILTSGLAFYMLSRFVSQELLIISGTVLAAGILLMHYIGMESMIIQADIQYDPFWVSISILVALISSIVAIQTFVKFRDNHTFDKTWLKIVIAILLGIAISGMHYTGMKATSFVIEPNHDFSGTHDHVGSNALALSIGITIFIIQLFILISRHIDRRSSIKLQESEERYRKLVELSPVAIGIHQYGEFSYINPAGMKVLGANSKKDVIGKNFLTFIHPDYHEIVKERWKTMHQINTHVGLLEEKMIRLDNEIIDVEIMGLPITINGEAYVQVIFQDITERKKIENVTHQLAYHDSLTGLPNRRLFEQRLEKALKQANTKTNTAAVMFIDLDGFKQVNDTYGHEAGDIVLISVAQKLTSCVRINDTVARLAGDEFTVLLVDSEEDTVVTKAKKILEILSLPIEFKNENVHVTPSIGISFFLDEDKNGESLIREADIAMYQAKQSGKNNFRIYGR